MIACAKVRYVRIAPRKVRLVLDLIRGKTTQQALTVLAGTSRRAAPVLDKLLRSAIANAKQKGYEDEGLYVSRIFADEGPTWKRWRAMSFGRGGRLEKRTCHITIELERKIIVPKVKKVESVPGKKRPRRRMTQTKKRGTAKHK